MTSSKVDGQAVGKLVTWKSWWWKKIYCLLSQTWTCFFVSVGIGPYTVCLNESSSSCVHSGTIYVYVTVLTCIESGFSQQGGKYIELYMSERTHQPVSHLVNWAQLSVCLNTPHFIAGLRLNSRLINFCSSSHIVTSMICDTTCQNACFFPVQTPTYFMSSWQFFKLPSFSPINVRKSLVGLQLWLFWNPGVHKVQHLTPSGKWLRWNSPCCFWCCVGFKGCCVTWSQTPATLLSRSMELNCLSALANTADNSYLVPLMFWPEEVHLLLDWCQRAARGFSNTKRCKSYKAAESLIISPLL